MSRIPTSGAMTWNDIQSSFGGSNPIAINEYYRNGSFVTTSSVNGNIPTSGQIEATDFRGADGFSGTTGTFSMGSSGGKIATLGYLEGSYGSNLGTAMTTGSGIKCNFFQIHNFVNWIFVSATASPATISNSNSNQLVNKNVSFSGAFSQSVTFLGNSTQNQSVPANFGGGSSGVTNGANAAGAPASSGTVNFSIA